MQILPELICNFGTAIAYYFRLKKNLHTHSYRMESGIIAYTRQKSLFDRLEVLANNLANTETNGFKSDLSVYMKNNNKIDGERNPTSKMLMSTDLSAGTFRATGRPLDIAIDGDGFFEVDTPLGPRFTRAGSFSLDDQGQIITAQGYVVQGSGGAVALDPNDTEIRIDKNGEISALNNGEQVVRGQIGVVTFADKSQLKKVGNSLFSSETAPENAATGTYTISQGTLEQSNVNSISQITELIDVTRGVQQVAKIIDTQYQLERNAVSRIAGTQ